MKTWHYADAAKQQHQATEDQLPDLVNRGVITPATMVWTSGLANWQPSDGALPMLFSGGGSSPSAPPPIPAEVPSGRGGQRSHEVDYEIFGDDMQIVEVELDPGEVEVITYTARVATGSSGVLRNMGFVTGTALIEGVDPVLCGGEVVDDSDDIEFA